MATRAAHKRLTREYAHLSQSPVDYITAHPAETNILEWHYILTGPPGTPYDGGQYWGTLSFPPDYPFAPPAIRMHTPSGRFRVSERLCLSISDFHPKSFNPAWEVGTILLGVLSFMTGEEMTTGGISATEGERKVLAARTRWWNSTGGGSTTRKLGGKETEVASLVAKGFGAIKAGDGGKRFKEQWPEIDEENWKWMEEGKIDPQTGKSGVVVPVVEVQEGEKTVQATPVVARAAVEAPRLGWVGRNKWYLAIGLVLSYIMVARIMAER